MELTPQETQLILRERRWARRSKFIWLAVPIWLIWIALMNYFEWPRFDLPLPTVLMLVILPFAYRPVVNAKILSILEKYTGEDLPLPPSHSLEPNDANDP